MKLVIATLVFALIAVTGRAARAECNCVAVAGDVPDAVQGMVAGADSLYARADFEGALKLYAQAYASSKASALLYAQAMCDWQLGLEDDAEAMFAAYLEAGGELLYRDRAEAALDDVRGGVVAGGGAVIGGVGGVVGGVGGIVGGVAEGGVGAGGAVVGELRGATAKPKKVAKGAAMLLGVVAVVALGAVAIHGIYTGIKDDVDVNGIDTAKFDYKFGLGLGISGVIVGGTAIYLYGLTAATGAVGAACVGSAAPRPSPAYGLSALVKF